VTALMDHRIADRRQAVREAGARRRLRRLLIGAVLAGLVGVGAWFVYQSSYLAVGDITIDGHSRSRAAEIVTVEGIEIGVPTINVKAAALESALLEDPWIAAASVIVTWPGSVDVLILEYEAAAWVAAGEAWLLVSSVGTVLERAEQPASNLPLVDVASEPVEPGTVIGAGAIAAVEFLDALNWSIAAQTEITGTLAQLSARMAGHTILLGYGTDMTDKAEALMALLDSGVPAGAEISLVAPQRPAIKPQGGVESSKEVLGESSSVG
jgi:cell division protein FtsQ